MKNERKEGKKEEFWRVLFSIIHDSWNQIKLELLFIFHHFFQRISENLKFREFLFKTGEGVKPVRDKIDFNFLEFQSYKFPLFLFNLFSLLPFALGKILNFWLGDALENFTNFVHLSRIEHVLELNKF